MKIFVCFFACWIVEISGSKIDDMCADQNVFVDDFLMPHQYDNDTTILPYKADHGKFKASIIFRAVTF